MSTLFWSSLGAILSVLITWQFWLLVWICTVGILFSKKVPRLLWPGTKQEAPTSESPVQIEGLTPAQSILGFALEVLLLCAVVACAFPFAIGKGWWDFAAPITYIIEIALIGVTATAVLLLVMAIPKIGNLLMHQPSVRIFVVGSAAALVLFNPTGFMGVSDGKVALSGLLQKAGFVGLNGAGAVVTIVIIAALMILLSTIISTIIKWVYGFIVSALFVTYEIKIVNGEVQKEIVMKDTGNRVLLFVGLVNYTAWFLFPVLWFIRFMSMQHQ